MYSPHSHVWLKKSSLTWILAWCSPPILTPWTEGLRCRGLPSTPSTAWSPLGRWWTRRGSGGWSPTPSYCCSAGPSTWARSWGWTAPCSRTLLFSRSSFLIYVPCICLTEDSASNILRLTQSLVQQNQLEHILREIGIKDVQHQLDTDVGADCLDLSDVGDGFLVRTVGAAGTLRPSVRSLPRSPREGGCPSGKVTNWRLL